MIFDFDDSHNPPEDQDQQTEVRIVPDYENEFVRAKTFLQKASTFSGDNLYDHLTDVLNKILAERPENVIDFFEEYSRKVKEKRFRPLTDHLEDIYVAPGRYELANKLLPLLKIPVVEEGPAMDPEDEDLADMSRNDMLQLLYYFEQAGLGLPRSEMFCIMLSMRKLIRQEPIASIRFWGKIYGLYKNYLVVETELKEDEYMKRNEQLDEALENELRPVIDTEALKAEEEALREIAQRQEEAEEEGDMGPVSKIPRPLPPAPLSQYEKPPEPPNELSGVGVNKKVFYVCNEVGDPWIELPDVTPRQIRTARQVYKSFTGNLDQEIVTYPEFPGNEMNYLRAQIARISAGTQISPLGFYTFNAGGGGEDEEEEEGEEQAGGMKTTYQENPKYDPVPIGDLVDGSMSFWVHHTLYILPQGRTSWWNPNPLPQGEEMDEEVGEEEEGGKGKLSAEPETGPPLLTPLSEDASLETVTPWSVRMSSGLTQDLALAIVRSNIWPGAYCFSTQGKLFQNIYLGYGLKYLSQNFSPFPLPPVQQDYPIGPEIMEITDPTGAEEEIWRIAHLPIPKPLKGEGDEGEEEENEEEEEEEEDD